MEQELMRDNTCGVIIFLNLILFAGCPEGFCFNMYLQGIFYFDLFRSKLKKVASRAQSDEIIYRYICLIGTIVNWKRIILFYTAVCLFIFHGVKLEKETNH